MTFQVIETNGFFQVVRISSGYICAAYFNKADADAHCAELNA